MSFSEQAFAARLAALNNTQQSIQTLSAWVDFHRRHAERIVNVWAKELKKADDNKKIVFLYLANDVVQTTRRRGQSELIPAFAKIIADAVGHAFRHGPPNAKKSIQRLIDVWQERKVFASNVLDEIRSRCAGMPGKATATSSNSTHSGASAEITDEVARALEADRRETEKEAVFVERAAGIDAVLASAAGLNSSTDATVLRDAERQLVKAENTLREYMPRLRAARDRSMALVDMLMQRAEAARAAASSAETALSKTVAQISVAENAKRNIQALVAALPEPEPSAKRVRTEPTEEQQAETPPVADPEAVTPPYSPERTPSPPPAEQGGEQDYNPATSAFAMETEAPPPIPQLFGQDNSLQALLQQLQQLQQQHQGQQNQF